MERERKREKVFDQVVTRLEEDFDEDEIEIAKAFFVDFMTESGPFSQFKEGIDSESLEKISKDYGLEPADGIYILDMLEDMFLTGDKEEGGKIND